jgi:transposase-like protein
VHDTYENDRPPVVGTVGGESGQVRLGVLQRTDGERLRPHVHGFTGDQATVYTTVYTDEWKSYNRIERDRQTACHSAGEWARDDDGDGIREVHVNAVEGLWTTVHNFLRPFQGVHKKHLGGYAAICGFKINLKRVTPAFVAALVRTLFLNMSRHAGRRQYAKTVAGRRRP